MQNAYITPLGGATRNKLLHKGKVGSGRMSLKNAFLGFRGWVGVRAGLRQSPGSYLNKTLGA